MQKCIQKMSAKMLSALIKGFALQNHLILKAFPRYSTNSNIYIYMLDFKAPKIEP